MSTTAPGATAATSNPPADHTYWTELARYLLVRHVTAGATTTYLDFYTEMRNHMWPVPALPTNGPKGNNWGVKTGALLYAVTGLNKLHGEPMLASAVRHQSDGEVGDGYPGAVLLRYGYQPLRYTEHADIEFGKCRQVFA